MPVNKPHLSEPGIYFITFTNYNWLPLIQLTGAYDLVYKWFDYLKSQGHYVCGYVIMPNHIHVLIGFQTPANSLNTIIGNGKRFIAYGIVQRLQSAGERDILATLAESVRAKDRSKGQRHVVFQPSFDIKTCINLRFINQKLDYMHNNPLAKKWSLAPDTISYLHSSARYYETGDAGYYPITNAADLIDKNWDTLNDSSLIPPGPYSGDPAEK